MTERIYPEFELANIQAENQTSSILNNTIEQSPTASTNESTVMTDSIINERNHTLPTISNISEPIATFKTTIFDSTTSNDYKDNYGLICMPPCKYHRHWTYSRDFFANCNIS